MFAVTTNNQLKKLNTSKQVISKHSFLLFYPVIVHSTTRKFLIQLAISSPVGIPDNTWAKSDSVKANLFVYIFSSVLKSPQYVW